MAVIIVSKTECGSDHLTLPEEGTLKDGEVISEECWDINGNKIDCSD